MKKRERDALLKKAYEKLGEAYDLLQEANEAEQEALENWPENLQGTDRYEEAGYRADIIDEVTDTIEDQYNAVGELIGQ